MSKAVAPGHCVRSSKAGRVTLQKIARKREYGTSVNQPRKWSDMTRFTPVNAMLCRRELDTQACQQLC